MLSHARPCRFAFLWVRNWDLFAAPFSGDGKERQYRAFLGSVPSKWSRIPVPLVVPVVSLRAIVVAMVHGRLCAATGLRIPNAGAPGLLLYSFPCNSCRSPKLWVMRRAGPCRLKLLLPCHPSRLGWHVRFCSLLANALQDGMCTRPYYFMCFLLWSCNVRAFIRHCLSTEVPASGF